MADKKKICGQFDVYFASRVGDDKMTATNFRFVNIHTHTREAYKNNSSAQGIRNKPNRQAKIRTIFSYICIHSRVYTSSRTYMSNMLNFMILWIILNTHFAAYATHIYAKREKFHLSYNVFFECFYAYIYCFWCVLSVYCVILCVRAEKGFM